MTSTLAQFADLEVLDLMAEALADDRSAIFRSLPREPRAKPQSGGRLIPTKVEQYMLARYREQVGLVLRTTIKDRVTKSPELGTRFVYRPEVADGNPAAPASGTTTLPDTSTHLDLGASTLQQLARASLEVDPCGAAWIQNGICAQVAGHYHQATKELLEYARIAPQKRLRILALNNAAESQLDAGHWQQAIVVYDLARSLDPESPFLLLRSLLAAYRGSHESSFESASRAAEEMLYASHPWVTSMRDRTIARYALHPSDPGFIKRPELPPSEPAGEVTATALDLT